MRRTNQNLTREEGAVLRALAEFHGLKAPSGPYVGRGSALGIQRGLIAGDLALVSLAPDDRAALAAWLDTLTPPAPLAELVAGLAAQLRHRAGDAVPAADASPEISA